MNPEQWAEPILVSATRDADAYDRLSQVEDLLPGAPSAPHRPGFGSAYDEALDD